MHSTRHAVLGPLLVVCLVLTACGTDAATSAPMAQTVAGAGDVGAAARDAVLDRYDGRAVQETAAQVIPDLVGLTPEDAAEHAAEAGFDVRVVPFDPESPITGQSPAYGQPAPLDGVIEVRQGPSTPATDEPAQASASATPDLADPPADDTLAAAGDGAATPTPDPMTPDPVDPQAVAAAPVQQTTAAAPSYVLPPHTDGLLRTNPLFLPALPLGTQLTGNASWYGPGFHGNTTACGGVYDQNGPTIAARELRCGTIVRITGPSGATVEATVTDWGPAEWTGRRFDLSAAVFNAIAPLGAGVIPVRVVTANVPA